MIKINSLELDDVKRIKALKLEPTQNGLTVIGGKNNQGKTSVLDLGSVSSGLYSRPEAKYKAQQRHCRRAQRQKQRP